MAEQHIAPMKKVCRSTNHSPKNIPAPKAPTPVNQQYYVKEQLPKAHRMDNSASTKSFTIPLGLSSDRQMEASLDQTPILKANATTQKNDKLRRPTASSPSGAS